MFALFKSEITEERNCLHFAAGNSVAVDQILSKLQKKYPDIEEHITISSEFNVVNDFKHKLKHHSNLIMRMNIIEVLVDTGSQDYLEKVVLDLFFQCNSCKANNILVCQKCGLMRDRQKILGNILYGIDEVMNCYKFKKDWICDECKAPVEFALISWTSNCSISSSSNYIAMAGQKNCNQIKLCEIRRTYPDAQVVTSIQPSFKEKEISHFIKSKFLSQKPYQILDNNVNFYQEFVVETFLNYFIKNYETNKKSIKFCRSCYCIFLRKGEKLLGQIFLSNKNSIDLLGFSPHWVCSKCEKSLFVLYAMETADGSLNYFISINQKDRYSLSKLEKDYVRIYPCFKFWCPFIKSSYIKQLIGQNKNVSVEGNRIQTKMDKYEFVRTIYSLHCYLSCRLVQITTWCCALCKRRVDCISSKNYGSFWCDKIEKFPHYGLYIQCRWHQVNNVLIFNIDKLSSISLFEDNEVVFKDSDAICFLGAELNRQEEILSPFLKKRVVFSETGMNKSEGGLKILVKDDILASYEKLPYSNKGLFIKIDLTSYCIILGVIHWPETCEDFPEATDDWINELDNIITSHNIPNVQFIIGGTFNCRIGNLNNGFKDEAVFWNGKLNVKRFSSDTVVNKRGERLVALMEKHKFILCNGRTTSDYPGKVTYCTEKDRIVTDLIWVNEDCGYKVKDMKICKLNSNDFKQHSALSLELSAPD